MGLSTMIHRTCLGHLSLLVALGLRCVAGAEAAQNTLDGKPYTKACRQIRDKGLECALDSAGAVEVTFLMSDNGRPYRGPLRVALAGQGGNFWKEAKVEDLPGAKGLAIQGRSKSGLKIKQTVTLSEYAVKCAYETDRETALQGQFPGYTPGWPANWFWAKQKGLDVRGELWGTYQPLTIEDSLTLTYLYRRVRLSLGRGSRLTLTSPKDLYVGATFDVPGLRKGDAWVTELEVASLPSEKAPLPDPAWPVVTRPFDRNKVVTGAPQLPTAPETPKGQALIEPAKAVVEPAKGQPAVFRKHEVLSFKLKLAPLRGGKAVPEAGVPLTCNCYNSLDDRLIEQSTITYSAEILEPAFTLKPKERGPYRLEFYFADRKLGEDEFVVAGPMPQRTISPDEREPYKLKLVDQVECATDTTHQFYSFSQKAHPVEHPALGKFMESSAETEVHFGSDRPGIEMLGWRIDGMKRDKPHLLEVEYPDIDDMVMTIQVGQCHNPKDPLSDGCAGLLGGGAISGLGHPITGKLQRYRGMFYPYYDWGLVELANYCRDQKPIRVSRIRVYEIENDLPMVEAGSKPQRLVGFFDECSRQVIHTFARAGYFTDEIGPMGNVRYDKYYKHFYLAAERMVKHLRHRGENVWFPGAFRYGHANYPSQVGRNAECCGWKDQLAVFAAMFAENGLTLVPTVPFTSDIYSLKMLDCFTDADVQAGAPTVMQVSFYGQQPPSFGSRVGNFSHPAVRKIMNAVAQDVARRYGRYPSVKAIAWVAGHDGWLGPSYSDGALGLSWAKSTDTLDLDNICLRSSYDDYTIALFEKELNKKIPISNPKRRFTERYEYIVKNLRQEWIDFRCRQRHRAVAELAEAVKAADPRLEFYFFDYWHYAEYAFVHDPDPLAVKMKKIGTDLKLMTSDPRFAYGYYFNEIGGHHESQMNTFPKQHRGGLRQINLDPSTTPFLDRPDGLGAWLGRQFFEGAASPDPKRPWYYTSIDGLRYPLSADRNSLEDLAVILWRSTPEFLCYWWCDGLLPEGHTDDVREFALAYRAIPLGKFTTVFRSDGPGICVRRLEGEGKPAVFYAVNIAPEPRRALVQTRGTLVEKSAGIAGPVKSASGWEIPLRKFELRVFAIEGGNLEAAREEKQAPGP